MQRTRILFVCLGNICRSPLAEGVFRRVVEERGLVERFEVDSAGTGGWHAGSPPDPRSIAIAARHGIDISGQKARRLEDRDFERFDLLLGMDASNLADMRARAASRSHGRIHLLSRYAHGHEEDVPDPYYGGVDGFGNVYRMLREASEALAGRFA